MLLIGFSMVKNEDDIIEQFIRHNLKYCDMIYIYDHNSSDNTVEIIKKCSEEGLAVVLINKVLHHFYNPGEAHAQSQVMTIMLRILFNHHGAAIYFPIDADEFIIDPGESAELRMKLGSLDQNSKIAIPWRCLVTKEISLNSERKNYPKDYIFAQKNKDQKSTGDKAALKISKNIDISKIFIEPGNHDITDPLGQLQTIIIENLSYYHAPIRSANQLLKKVIIGWLANVAQYGKNNLLLSVHWREMYHKISSNKALDTNDLFRIYNFYSNGKIKNNDDLDIFENNIYFNYENKYQDLSGDDFRVILLSIENIIDEYYKSKSKKT